MKDAKQNKIMPHAEYVKRLVTYQTAQSYARSLRLKVRSNNHRPDVRDKAQADLNALNIPARPIQPYGYQMFLDGDYHGFTLDGEEYLEQVNKYGQRLTAKIKPAAGWK